MSPLLTFATACLLVANPPILQSSNLQIVVNIPAYRLDVYVGGSLARTMPVAVGMARFPTPRGSYEITSIEWNPWWIPPDSPWAAKEKVTPPGPRNPMGRAKLNFRPLYFLHGTPLERSIGSAASHGCVRLRNVDVIDLAKLVHRFGTPGLTLDAIERMSNEAATTQTVQLDEPVPIDLRYDLVEVRGGRVMAYRDVYRLARRSPSEEVYAALAAAGVDTALIDPARVRALVSRLPASGRAAPVDSLLVSLRQNFRQEQGR